MDNIKRITVSKTPIERFYDVDQSTEARWDKPAGLWYSCGPEWLNWMAYNMADWFDAVEYIYELEIDPEDILFIRTYEELRDFNRIFGKHLSRRGNGIDWNHVADNYKGIEICPYIWRARHEFDWYYGWDIASGCIWDSSAIIGFKGERFTETSDTYRQQPEYDIDDYTPIRRNPSPSLSAVALAGLAGYLLGKK